MMAGCLKPQIVSIGETQVSIVHAGGLVGVERGTVPDDVLANARLALDAKQAQRNAVVAEIAKRDADEKKEKKAALGATPSAPLAKAFETGPGPVQLSPIRAEQALIDLSHYRGMVSIANLEAALIVVAKLRERLETDTSAQVFRFNRRKLTDAAHERPRKLLGRCSSALSGHVRQRGPLRGEVAARPRSQV